MMKLPEQKAFFISDWWVSPADGILSRAGEVVHIEPKVVEVLVYLAAHEGEVVTREDLEHEVWHGALVGYDAITSTIIKLRRALQDDPKQPHFVSTIPKRGYKLIAHVRYTEPADGTTGIPDGRPIPLPASTPETTSPGILLGFHMLVAALIGMLIAAAVVYWIAWSGTPQNTVATALGKRPTVLVLPFENLSHDPRQDYLADGMTEDLITDLSRTAKLEVLSNNTSYIYRGRHSTAQEVGKALHIDFVIQGNIRSVGHAIRVNAQLVDAKTGFNKWGNSYDRNTQEVFAVQHEITAGVVNALALHLTDKEKQRLARKATSNLKAYGFFHEGQKRSRRFTKEDNQAAEQAYRKAIEIDPGYGRAYGALAYCLGVDFLRAWTDTPVENLDHALELAKNAVAIDDSIPQTYWALGWAHLIRKEYASAEQAATKSIAIAPNYADGYGLLALIDNYEGKPKAAIKYIAKGMQLNPYYSWDYPYNLGRAYYDLGRYDKAITALEDAHQRNPNALFATIYLAASYVRAGRQDDAEWTVQEIQTMNPLITISHLRKITPSNQKLINPLLADLRKAGLPE